MVEFSFCKVMDRVATNISPVWAEQACSIKVSLIWFYFEFPDSIAHLYRETRASKTKTCSFFITQFSQTFCQTLWSEKEMFSTERSQNVSF